MLILLPTLNVFGAVGLQTPVLGWSNWNAWHNNINASIFHGTATFMKESGLLTAGYNYVTLGGIGYANGSTFPTGSHSWGPDGPGNITRNATGFLEIDPVRFPGGNEGMRALSAQIRAMGFRWGFYTEAGTTGCNGARGSSEGYEEKDAALFFEDFKSEYLMVDSCGIVVKPPPHGPPKDWPLCPGCSPRHAQARWEMTQWRNLIDAAVTKGTVPGVVLHDCHNGCASDFGGPTLVAAPCNTTDPAQQWSLPLDGSYGALVNAGNGLCVGCVSTGSCGGDGSNGTGYGMQACLLGAIDNGALNSRAVQAKGIGASNQLWNFSTGATDGGGHGGVITLACTKGPGSCTPLGLALATSANSESGAAVIGRKPNKAGSYARWAPKSLPGGVLHQFTTSNSGNELCLSSAGATVVPVADPWCLANNNMWRSNTDVLQNWVRTMVEVESLATQGHISRPGSWSFPDCMELGVPGEGSLTWQESMSVLALFAVTSSPLMLGNDAREGKMQQRLVDLLTNPAMLSVNQIYDAKHAFAGGRIATSAPARELWGKPLGNGTVAVVLLNRGGKAIGEIDERVGPLPRNCKDPTKPECTGCYIPSDLPQLSPCDDNATASTGAQTLTLNLDQIPKEWLGASEESDTKIASCEFFDIFATPHAGASLGRLSTFSAVVPPHGVRFLRLSDCSAY